MQITTPLHLEYFIKTLAFQPTKKQALITLIPTYENEIIWNKTYLFIPDATSFFTSATEFDLYISVTNDNYNNDISILLDNFKVIFRQ